MTFAESQAQRLRAAIARLERERANLEETLRLLEGDILRYQSELAQLDRDIDRNQGVGR